MDIAPDIRIADLCLMIGDTLVVGDVHIGYEETLVAIARALSRNNGNTS